MPISYTCFIAAALAALVGMSLGIHMGMNEDFTLAPAHAHLNLLGWVTMALYGLYYRAAPHRFVRLAWVQVIAALLGFPAMAGGLAVYLATGDKGFVPLVVAGSLLTAVSMLLFFVVLVLHAVGSFTSARASAATRLVFEQQ